MWVHPRDRKPVEKKPAKLWNNKVWQQCYDDWLRSLSAGTSGLYRLITSQFFDNPRLRPDQYTQAHVWAFLNAKCHNGRNKGGDPAVNTQIARLNALKSFYAFASGYDVTYRKTTKAIMTHRPPTHNIKLPEAPEVDRHMTDEELKRFFAVIPTDTIAGKRDRALFLCYFWTSRRLREIANLTWADIKQGAVFADGSVGVQYYWLGKGRASRSSAELPGAAWDAIVDYLKFSDRWDHMLPHSPIFTRHDPSARYCEETFLNRVSIGDIYRKYVKAAGLEGRYGTHDFRHTQATLTFEESGNNILEVMQKLDHKNAQMSWRYVRHTSLRSDKIARQLRNRYGNL